MENMARVIHILLVLLRIGNYGPVIHYINLEPSHNNVFCLSLNRQPNEFS